MSSSKKPLLLNPTMEEKKLSKFSRKKDFASVY